MADKCTICPIRTGCDIFSEMCRLTAREVVTVRPDLITNDIRNKRQRQRANGAKRHKRRVWLRTGFVPETKFGWKYDGRRTGDRYHGKMDSPRKQWDRRRKAAANYV